MRSVVVFSLAVVVVALLLPDSSAGEKQCGKDVGGKTCPNNLCCSRVGFCGYTEAYCGDGCQSQCNNVAGHISESTYNTLFQRRNHEECTSKGFYTYDAFIRAALSFPRFGFVENAVNISRREIAAFLAHISHETAGNHRVNDYMWGLCILQEESPPSNYCANPHYDCLASYHGRGPFQLRGNDRYAMCGEAIDEKLLEDPEILIRDPLASFKSAIWYWMTWRSETENPSCNEVITGVWHPDEEDKLRGWFPGFGLTINLVNGRNECGDGENPDANDRIAYYNKYTGYLQTTTGDYTDCKSQVPIGSQYPLLLATSK